MLISTLNQSFQKHRRLYFGIFAALIIIAFTPGLFSIVNGSAGSGKVGTVFGKSVSYRDLAPLQGELRILRMLGAIQEESEQMLFFYYAQKQDAKRYGVKVSDEELAKFIIDTKLFVDDKGAFDQTKYQQFLNGMTATGIPKKDVENAFRSLAVFQKLDRMLLEDLSVTDEEAKKVYQERNALRKVCIASFPVQIADEGKITEEEMKTYYQNNQERFQIPGSCKVVMVELADSKAASDFANNALKAMNNKNSAGMLAAFNAEAAKLKLNVLKDDNITSYSSAVAGKNLPQLAQNLSKSGVLVADPVELDGKYFVAAVWERVPARIAAYDEVKTDLRKYCAEDQAFTAQQQQLEKLRTGLMQSPDTAQLVTAFKALKDCTFSEKEFTLANEPKDFFEYIHFSRIGSMAAGSISEPLPDLTGGMQLILVTEIVLPDDSKFAADAEKYREAAKAAKAEQIRQAHQQTFMENVQFFTR